MKKKLLFATLFALAAINVNQVEFQNNSLIPQIHLTNEVSAESQYQYGYRHGRTDAQLGRAYGDNPLFQMTMEGTDWRRGYRAGYNSVR